MQNKTLKFLQNACKTFFILHATTALDQRTTGWPQVAMQRKLPFFLVLVCLASFTLFTTINKHTSRFLGHIPVQCVSWNFVCLHLNWKFYSERWIGLPQSEGRKNGKKQTNVLVNIHDQHIN